MPKKPLVSIIVPCYNHANYLPFCLNSILNQDFKNFEIIVINDASTDNSLEVAKDFAKKDSRIRVFSNEKNIGWVKTDNKGCKIAKGKYLNVFSADDGMLPGNLRKKVEILENNPQVSFVFSELRCIDENNNKLFDTPYRNMESYINRDDFLDLIEWGDFISSASLMVKKESLEQIGFWDEKLHSAEWFMLIKLCRKFKSAFINEPLVYFRFHERNFDPKGFEPFEKETLSIIETGGFSENEKRLLRGNIYYSMCVVYRQKKDFINSIKYLMKSLRHNPNCFFLHLKNKKIKNELIWRKFRKKLRDSTDKKSKLTQEI